jgi:hypothetical protein
MTEQKQVIVRTAKCSNWEYMDEGEIKTREVTVLYRNRTVRELRQFEAESKADPEKMLYLSDLLFPRLVGLPDLPELKGKELTIDWLEEQDPKNLKALQEAIRESENPEKK